MRLSPFLLALFFLHPLSAEPAMNALPVRAMVDYAAPLRSWDGFGFNYVEEAQSRDYAKAPQEYGGFSLLTEADRRKVATMVFGPDGLRVDLVKMFLDPWHQERPGGPYDHETTTRHMRDFVSRGLEIARADGRELAIISTLYGPPGFMTRQGRLRGRDFDPAMTDALLAYFVDWARYLVDHGYPLRYLSLHNEGDGWKRWPADGFDGPEHYNHDYNLYWPPELVVRILPLLRDALDAAGLEHVGVTPGETYSWDRFVDWGYASAIAADPAAREALGLITSHGFLNFGFAQWNSEHTARGTDLLRAMRPELHAWVTSTSWSGMDSLFVREIYGNIYESKINGLIPWAGIKRPGEWYGRGDPNASGAFDVMPDGELKILKGYYFYKQVTLAGRPGTRVCRTFSNDNDVKIIAWAAGDSGAPDAFVVIHSGREPREVEMSVRGRPVGPYRRVRTSEPEFGDENARALGATELGPEPTLLLLPPRSVTTYIAYL